jgi:hypothetical protein
VEGHIKEDSTFEKEMFTKEHNENEIFLSLHFFIFSSHGTLGPAEKM